MADKITPKEVDYSQWYIDIVLNAKLADYSPVKGSMVIRPRGYAIWERIRDEFDRRFKETGHQNAYFPLLIPMGFLEKEAEHVEGFAPELAVVTHGGGEKLEEPYCIRPTSETIIWSKYKDWIQSWRDLPLLINQWANVLRWEKRTRLFLRTSEFLWQEGHTAHETREEAVEETLRMLEVYRDVVERHLCIPVVTGIKSESEKFAGAVQTYCIEAMMQDRKALQAGTSHFLGQNFAKAFDVKFQNSENQPEFVYATSWGVSTRLIGALIMCHSDDRGLVLPPKLATDQVVIVPIGRKDDERAVVLPVAEQIRKALKAAGLGVVMDDDPSKSPGFKFAQHELYGTPLRLELGPRDLAENKAVVARRDTGEKLTIDLGEGDRAGVPAVLADLLSQIQQNLFDRALTLREEHTRTVESYHELKQILGDEGGAGMIWAHWDGTSETEAKIQEETGATIRCIPFEEDPEPGACIVTGQPSAQRVVFARAY